MKFLFSKNQYLIRIVSAKLNVEKIIQIYLLILRNYDRNYKRTS